MVPRLPLATPSSAMALWPHTTRSPTASWRSSTCSRSAPRRPWAASSSWQAVLSRSTSVRRAANTMTSWAGVALGVLVGGPPVLQQGQGGGRLGVGGHHPVMGLVGGHRLLDQPASGPGRGLRVPRPGAGGGSRSARWRRGGGGGRGSRRRRRSPPAAGHRRPGPPWPGRWSACSSRRASLRLPTMPASSTTSTVRRVQLLMAAVEVAQEPVAGGHVLEPLALQAHGGDPGRGGGQEPVAVQLPGMAGDARGRRSCPSRPAPPPGRRLGRPGTDRGPSPAGPRRRSDARPGPRAPPHGRPWPSAPRSGRWRCRPAAARPPAARGWTSGAPPGPGRRPR